MSNNGWQPIESAPRDGTIIRTGIMHKWGAILYPSEERFVGGQFVSAHDGRRYDPQPTHWQPLPEPPTSAAPESPTQG